MYEENWYSRLFYTMPEDPAMAPYWLAMAAFPDLYKTPEDVEKAIFKAKGERERPQREAEFKAMLQRSNDKFNCIRLCRSYTEVKKDRGRDGKVLHMSIGLRTEHKPGCVFYGTDEK